MPDDNQFPQPILNIEDLWVQINAKKENRQTKPILAIFGSVDFWHPDSEGLCQSIGRELAKTIPSLIIVTGANAVVHDKIACSFHDEITSSGDRTADIYHLAPWGYQCNFSHGQKLCVGRDMAERRTLLARCATVALSVEGGPGTADEMIKAVGANVPLIALGRSGGASGGMFDAPSCYNRKPEFICQKDWDQCWDTTIGVDDSAKAVARIVKSVVDSSV